MILTSMMASTSTDLRRPCPDVTAEGFVHANSVVLADVNYVNTSGLAQGIYVSGNYAYVTDRDSGLNVIDISDPTDPGEPINKSCIGGEETADVFVSGDYAYVADGPTGLAVFDVSNPLDPGDPVYEGSEEDANGVFVNGDFAFVADGFSGLAVINISDPAHPETVTHRNIGGNCAGVFVSGDYAYVATYSSPFSLAVIDISDPTNPGSPRQMGVNSNARQVFVSGDYAYVACSISGLAIIDISNPMDPGTPVYADIGPGGGTELGVFVYGDHAYVAAGGLGLAVIDITDPMNPGAPVYIDTNGYARNVFVDGNYAYVADRESGLAIIQTSVTINPVLQATEQTSDSANGVFVSGDYAYVADRYSGLAVIDISDPTDPGPTVSRNTDGEAYDVFVNGDYVYVADGSAGLAVIDISNPTNPGDPVYVGTTGEAYDVFVSGDFAYVAAGSAGLAVINISDPMHPEVLVYRETRGTAYGVCVSGDYVYLVDGSYGLTVTDISDPTNPGVSAYQSTAGSANDVYVDGDFAYIACGNAGLAVTNVSNPVDPIYPEYERTTRNARGVYVSGDLALIADGELTAINISDPLEPSILAYADTDGLAADVYIDGDFAYVASGPAGLEIVRVRITDSSDPSFEAMEITGFEGPSPSEFDDVTILAMVTDPVNVSEVKLSYSTDNQSTWTNVTMITQNGVNWTATIPSQSADTNVSYKVYATDTFGNLAVSDTNSYVVISGYATLLVLFAASGAVIIFMVAALFVVRGLKQKVFARRPFGVQAVDDDELEPVEAVQVLRGCEVVGGQFEYKVKVMNKSDFIITNVTVSIVAFPEDCLKFSKERTKTINMIEPLGFRSPLFVFAPTKDCVEGKIQAAVSFIDYTGKLCTLEVEPYVIKSVCDLLKPYEATLPQLDLILLDMKTTKKELLVNVSGDVVFERAKALLPSRNFHIVTADEHVEGEMFVGTIRGVAEGKYTGSRVAVKLMISGRVEVQRSNVRVEVLGDNEAMLPITVSELADELQEIRGHIMELKANMELLVKGVTLIMSAAGESTSNIREVQTQLSLIEDKSDSGSVLARELIGIVGSKYQAVDSGEETLEWALEDLVHQVEDAADEAGADQSLKKRLVGRVKRIGKKKAEEGSANTLWTIAKAGLRILGIPIP
jgi:hypothetical protein